MGGMGDSGLGRRHGADGLLKYTAAQIVAHQRLHGFTPPGGIEHAQWARTLTRALKTLRALGLR
jgi:succinate-semialdehyde dehydrogenase/glutarate-semialdehyde dehydrogenase